MEHLEDKLYSEETATTRDINILTVFSMDELNEIQNTIAKVTGLAFVTVDYKGDVVSESTRFCEFCRIIRDDPQGVLLCRMSDAAGSIMAATNRKVSIYKCPYGLIDIAIPIIAKGKYLGGFIGGQVRCEDAPSSVVTLSKNMVSCGESLPWHVDDAPHLLKEVRSYRYEDIVCVANLVEMIITKLTENRLMALQSIEWNEEKSKELYGTLLRLNQENRILRSKYYDIKRSMEVVFNRNLLNILANSAIIESAMETNQAILTYLAMVSSAGHGCGESTIKDELDRIELFVALLRRSYGTRLLWLCDRNVKIERHSIPFMLLMPLVASLVYAFFNAYEGILELGARLYREEDWLHIQISDNQFYLSSAELEFIQKSGQADIEDEYEKEGIVNEDRKRVIKALISVRKALVERFDRESTFKVLRKAEKGILVHLSYPAKYGEVLRYE